jgi:ubiquinone/menaquinone biosynthesis C-methylase UbiE
MQRPDITNQDYLLNEEYKDASKFKTCLGIAQSLGVQPVDWYQWIFDLIRRAPRCRVLELGCGPGNLWQSNLKRIPADWEITLSDFSPGMLKDAQDNLSQSGRRFTFQVIDAQAIPFGAASFDRVIANCMLYHVPDRSRALSEIRRVLKPGGYLYAATFSQAGFSALKKLTDSVGIPTWLDKMGFSRENGAEQLAGWFSQIELHHLENSLVVKEADPLVALLRALPIGAEYNETKLQHLRNVIQQELAQRGEIRFNIELALFEAS